MTENQNPSAKHPPWPEHLTAAGFRAHSNFFIGLDETALYKAMFSIRTMVSAGMFLAFLLPKHIVLFLASAMMVPQLVLTLARHFGLIEDRLRKAHPVFRGRYAGEIEGDFCVHHTGLCSMVTFHPKK